MSESDSLVEQVRTGESLELQVLAAQGILPLPIETLIPLQVHLAGADNPMIADYARAALEGVEPKVAIPYLASEAPEAVLRWFARSHSESQLVEAILRRRDVPRDLLVEVAPELDPDLQEVLLLRQDAIVEQPSILDALQTNSKLSIYAGRRIREYREHLLPRAAFATRSARTRAYARSCSISMGRCTASGRCAH